MSGKLSQQLGLHRELPDAKAYYKGKKYVEVTNYAGVQKNKILSFKHAASVYLPSRIYNATYVLCPVTIRHAIRRQSVSKSAVRNRKAAIITAKSFIFYGCINCLFMLIINRLWLYKVYI